MALQQKNSLASPGSLQKGRWRIAVYIRLSREDGNDESLSISNQRKILLEFIENSFGDNYDALVVYADDGQSGTDSERPGFQRMMRDAEAGKVNCIVCKNLSRAFRNYSDQGYFLESLFPRLGIRFIALGEPRVDTFLNPEAVNGLEIPINGLMNDRFACKTSGDIRRTFDTKRRKGEFIGAFAPYGYRKDPENKNHLLIDPEPALVVRDIFQWYVYGENGARADGGDGSAAPAGGMSKEGIARKLNERGILNPAAYKRSQGLRYRNPQSDRNDGLWRGSGVKAILSNEMYTGMMVQGRQRVISYKIHDKRAVPREQWYRVPDTHEAIIGRDLFLRAQELQAGDRRRAPGEGRNHLFSGMLKCADCGRAMTRKPSKNRVYYNCSTYKRKSRTKCSIHSIRLDVLEEAVLTAIRMQLEKAVDWERLEEHVRSAAAADSGKGGTELSLKRCVREMEQAEWLLDALYLDWKGGELSREQYERMREKASRRIRRLREAMDCLEREQRTKSACGVSCLEALFERKNIQSLDQAIIAGLIQNIYICEGGSVTIVFRSEDPYKKLPVGHRKTEQ